MIYTVICQAICLCCSGDLYLVSTLTDVSKMCEIIQTVTHFNHQDGKGGHMEVTKTDAVDVTFFFCFLCHMA